jgi:hypothetical protein
VPAPSPRPASSSPAGAWPSRAVGCGCWVDWGLAVKATNGWVVQLAARGYKGSRRARGEPACQCRHESKWVAYSIGRDGFFGGFRPSTRVYVRGESKYGLDFKLGNDACRICVEPTFGLFTRSLKNHQSGQVDIETIPTERCPCWLDCHEAWRFFQIKGVGGSRFWKRLHKIKYLFKWG